MAWHEILFPLLVSAIRGLKVKPVEAPGGSVNYRLMVAFTAWMADPTPANEKRCLELLAEMREVGHLSLRGPHGVATEAGSPGMHWTFDIAPVVGAMKHSYRVEKGGKVTVLHAEMKDAAVEFIRAELGLNRYCWHDGVGAAPPCTRVKDELHQAPLDHYRNVFCWLLDGGHPQVGHHFWEQDQAIAVTTLRTILLDWPEVLAPLRDRRATPAPRLYLPVLGRDLDGGWLRWIERTPEAEAAMGADACNWTSCVNGHLTFGVDWEGLPS